MSARLNIAIDSWALGHDFWKPLITIGAYMLAENGLNESSAASRLPSAHAVNAG